MTDREIMQQALEALEADEHNMVPDQEGHMVFRKGAAITALRERLAQPEQEPVEWQHRKPIMDSQGNTRGYYDWLPGKGLERWPHRRLYTSPPQRTWVGLTDEEIWKTISRIGTSDSDVNPYAKLADARAIEAKLKEKNNG